MYFNEINDSGLNNLYIDNEFSDFDREFLIPHKLSSLGPCIAIGDVNGDKLEDLYIGGSNGNIGSLYLQNNKNKFIISPQDGFKDDAMFEDVSALFFDADDDKDFDLLIVSGGNEYYNGAPNYNSRVYFNDGKGNFKLNLNSLLKVANCGGSGAVNDYDNDGDLDIFIGCRSLAGKYPLAPNSYIFRNDGGKFVDVTNQVSPDFAQIGMVSDIKFADLDGDKINELILVGEWMPITILKFKNGQYVNITKENKLENSTGWWNCVQIADIDKDGDLDIIGGNEGINTRLKVSEKEPLEIYAKDFDNNGAFDPIITYYNLGKKLAFGSKRSYY
ncbi:MAG: VCBS repeat-containing protein [Saprospiraceae bacterium]|nr:VCBS repeat-containing protein [Saprospiraceae bacterium]